MTTEMMMVSGIHPWRANPRVGELRCIPEFAEQLKAEGVKEDLHVFLNNGVVTLMQGHRRRAACLLAGIETVWVQNHGAISEREAFEILLSLQNGVDPFNTLELTTAARTAVHEMGMTAAEVARVFHRSAQTVQMYLDLETLPQRVQEALYAGKITLELVKLFRQIEMPAEQVQALGEVLDNKGALAPMSTKQAEIYLMEQFITPQKRRKKWSEMRAGLLKRYSLADGYSWVEYEQREEFVMGESMPEDGFSRAGEFIAGDLLINAGDALTWGELAQVYGVPVFIAPAMALEGEKFLLLVTKKAVREADALAEVPRLLGKGKKGALPQKDAKPEEEKTGGDAMDEMDDEDLPEDVKGPEPEQLRVAASLPEFPLERWRRIFARLLENKTLAMNDGVWKLLVEGVWQTLVSHDGIPSDALADMMLEIDQDTASQRAGLRKCFMGVLAMLVGGMRSDAADGLMDEIEEGLGI